MLNQSIGDYVSREDKETYTKVRELIRLFENYSVTLQDFVSKSKISYHCHTLCRAIAYFIDDVTIVDGLFLGLKEEVNGTAKGFQLCTAAHTWLITKDKTIIDPYPVGVLDITPLIIPQGSLYAPFGRNLYYPDPNITKIAQQRSMYYEGERIKRVLKKILAHK